MDWKILKDKIYYLDGSLRDIYIRNTTKDDWEVWTDFINNKYKTSFHIYKKEITKDKIDFATILDYWNGNQDNCSMATVFIEKIIIKAYFFHDKEIENDIMPTEINSNEDHEQLMNYLTELSKILNKQVILTPENEPEIILIAVDKEEIKINI